jgi:hypothetical protein
MPRSDYKTCRRCKRHSDDCGQLSHTRLCGDCSTIVLAENIIGLAEHSGEPLRKWRIGMVRCAFGPDLEEALWPTTR